MLNRFFILILSFLFTYISNAQICTTLVAYDYVEAYNWTGLWFGNTLSSGYYNNASVTTTLSAAIYGGGGGTSAIEQDWYVLPNITGLNPAYTYQFKFRLGSYVFTNTTATTRGVDAPDLVEVQVSTNGEVSYTSEIRITGNANATWNYNTAGVINKTANGALTTYTPAGGGNRTTTGDGYSDITLTLTGISQIAIDILCRVNAAGEEWWLDNMELYEIGPCAPLPVELVKFEAVNQNTYNNINWETLTETNNSHFILNRSLNGLLWSEIVRINGNGNVYEPTLYNYRDYGFSADTINYYLLKQVDFDGTETSSKIISVDNTKNNKPSVIKIIDLNGIEVDENSNGIIIKIYSNGRAEKVVNIK